MDWKSYQTLICGFGRGYNVSFTITYEIDKFGKLKNDYKVIKKDLFSDRGLLLGTGCLVSGGRESI